MKAQNKLCDRDVSLLAAGKRIEDLSRRAQPLARIVDTAPPNSPHRIAAARELCRITKKCVELAVAQGDQAIEIAESSAASVHEMCPVEAADAGL